MQLQEMFEEEISKILEIYRLAVNSEDGFENDLTDEEIYDLVDYIFGSDEL